MYSAQALSILTDDELDLVNGGGGSLVSVGPISVNVKTTVGIATVGVIFQVTDGGKSIVNITGVNETIYSR